MKNYIINARKDENGYNEVHTTICNHLPEYQNRRNLGSFANTKEAVAYAKRNGYSNVDGCYYCSNEAHHK